jgi:hypothetical protein
LTFAADLKVAIEAISDSKLLSGADYCDMRTISDKNAGLTGSDKDQAILALIDIDTSSCIEEEDVALLTVRYLKLLHL